MLRGLGLWSTFAGVGAIFQEVISASSIFFLMYNSHSIQYIGLAALRPVLATSSHGHGIFDQSRDRSKADFTSTSSVNVYSLLLYKMKPAL